MTELVEQESGSFVEFSNINRKMENKKYRYGYAVRNFMALKDAVVKFDFESGTNR